MASRPGILVKFRPAGPWRFGPDDGARDRADVVGHSDLVYSAVCSALAQVGDLAAWLKDTAEAPRSAVRFSSLFPFQGRVLFAPPPANLWPPPSQRLRFKGARFAPLALLQDLAAERPLKEERWEVDPQSACVIPSGGDAPYRFVTRTAAGVDRLSGAAQAHRTAGIEFGPGAGLWCFVEFDTEEARERWRAELTAAFRWLGDSGLGGERTRGWGRSESVEFSDSDTETLLLGTTTPAASTAWWLLSLYSPAPADTVDWSRGEYSLITRQGRVDKEGTLKRSARLVTEGSVIVADALPTGTAVDVAPAGHPHPVYRTGFAIAVPVPWKEVVDRPLAALNDVVIVPTEQETPV
jgi:CRISPR type III-A-associated RAMP protein Csm4